jgi:nicotinate-nucleotide adenylyltransferase
MLTPMRDGPVVAGRKNPSPYAWPKLPTHAPGMAIGLFGGSFNPPHAAHLLVTLEALRRLRLDRVWWLVTPGNPLKERRELAPLPERLAAARRLARHPRVIVTALEAGIGTRYTLDTLRSIRRRAFGVRFVWIMGADNLAGFHRWRGWRHIVELMPIAVLDRPGFSRSVLTSRLAATFGTRRLPERAAPCLAATLPPAWIFLHQRLSPLSSTMLRQTVLKLQ